MTSARRRARQAAVAPVVAADADPLRVTQCQFLTPTHGRVRVWSRGGVPARIRVEGRTFTRAWDAGVFAEWLRDPEIRAGLRDAAAQ